MTNNIIILKITEFVEIPTERILLNYVAILIRERRDENTSLLYSKKTESNASYLSWCCSS